MQVKVSIKSEDGEAAKVVEEAWTQDLVVALIANITTWLAQGHTREEIEEAVKDAFLCMVLDVKDTNLRNSYSEIME